MPKTVNADTPQHTIFIWGMWDQMTKADQRWLQKMKDDEDEGNSGKSINDLIRIVRKLEKMGYSSTKVDISIDTNGLLFTQWNDGIEMSITSLDRIYVLLDDLLLLRKWFNAPR